MELASEIPTWNGRPSGSSPPRSDRRHTRMPARPSPVPHLRSDTICRAAVAQSSRTMTIDRFNALVVGPRQDLARLPHGAPKGVGSTNAGDGGAR
jgi:hypothetical protein